MKLVDMKLTVKVGYLMKRWQLNSNEHRAFHTCELSLYHCAVYNLSYTHIGT